MEKASFKVGQLAEMRTFEDGFRSAWFRCKINDIKPNENKILLDYIDFELEEPSWVKIYQMPLYARKSKHIKRQLMVRPQYPAIYYKDQMPPLSSISQESVVIHGKWKVGNMVDWFKDDCFWSARIVKLLSHDKVQVGTRRNIPHIITKQKSNFIDSMEAPLLYRLYKS
ncbi:putative Agenet-like domain-containing protein [Helianthus anomalus]